MYPSRSGRMVRFLIVLQIILLVAPVAMAQVPALPSTGGGPLLSIRVHDPTVEFAPGVPRAFLVDVRVSCAFAARPDGALVNLSAVSTDDVVILPPQPVRIAAGPDQCGEGFVNGTGFILASPAVTSPAGVRRMITVTGSLDSVTASGSTNFTVAFAGTVSVTLSGLSTPAAPGEARTLKADVAYRFNGPGSVRLTLDVPSGVTSDAASAVLKFPAASRDAPATASSSFTLVVDANSPGGEAWFTVDARAIHENGTEMPRNAKASSRLTIVPPTPDPSGVEEKDAPAPGFVLLVPAVAAAAGLVARRRT